MKYGITIITYLGLLFFPVSIALTQNQEPTLIEEDESSRLLNILELDVFAYYDIDKTELQKKEYKQTDEYKNQLSELKTLRTEVFKKTYSIVLRTGIYPYDLKKHCYFSTDNVTFYTPRSSSYPLKLKYGIVFPALPTLNQASQDDRSFIEEFVKIPCPESLAAEIEEHLPDIQVMANFTIKGLKRFRYKQLTFNLIVADQQEFVLEDKNNGKVFLRFK